MNTNNGSGLLARCESPAGKVVTAQVDDVGAAACPRQGVRHNRVLVIVPDGTRTGPVGQVFKSLHAHIGDVTDKLDVLIALGTHQPMSEAAICGRLEISLEERAGMYRKVAFHTHAWDQTAASRQIG